MRGKSEWPIKTHPNLGGNLIDVVLFEAEAKGNTGGAIGRALSSVRFLNVGSGPGDFPKAEGGAISTSLKRIEERA